MKPILLEIEAFGPYSGSQPIDFRELKDANMFLIHGSTGGGKTTILDAICYALYGETSGKERDPDNMRSHFAKDDHLTEVRFTFKVGQETYMVHRIPTQLRPKKVGEGFTEQLADATLYKLQDDEKPEPIASKVSDVKNKIIDIIGFDSDQFRQVIIIPQGQFRKLLVAKSEERQKILGEIFQTRKYKLVEEKIREEERTLKNEVAAIRERRKEQIKNIKYRPDTLLEQLMQNENIDPDQIIMEVDALSKMQDEEIDLIAEEIAASDEKLKLMATEITKATNNNTKYNEKITVKKQYDDLIKEEELYKAKEKEYSLGQKALPLRQKEQYINDLVLQKEQIQKEVINVRKMIKELEEAYAQATIQIDGCKAKEPETKKMEIELNKAVEEYKPKSITLISLEREKESAQKEINEAKIRQDKLKEEKETIQKEIEEAEKILGQRQTLNDTIRAQELKSERLSTTLTQKKQLVKLETRHKDLQTQYKKVNTRLSEVGKEYAKANETHNNLLQQWIRGQAGELARNLKDNEACPVCGSTSHPNPAHLTDEITTEKALQEKKKALDQVQEIYQETLNKHASIKTQGAESKEQIEAQKEILGEYTQITLEEIEKLYQEIEEEKTKIAKSLIALGKLEERSGKQKQATTKIDQEMTESQEKDKENADKFTSVSTKIDQIKKGIPERLQVKEELDQYISQLTQTIKKQRETYEKSEKQLEEVRSKKIKSETREKEKNSQLKTLTLRYEKEMNDFKRERESSGFETFEGYKNAYKSQTDLGYLDTQIKEYRKLYSAIEAQYKKLKEETKDITLVDIELLDKAYEAIAETKDKLSRSHQTIMVEKQHNEAQVAIIIKSNKKIKKKEKTYSIVGSLYKAARGSNPKGLSFERFIQSSLFEDVLIRANERLVLMSNNRYELYRSDNRETKASQAGLDMEVLDTYTGKKRHVHTLSGGEGFMASLSLALGLADVVQSYAGGISLDTIFIDEGFGTLDTESLDAAIQTLIALQQSGRLVGIISHVPELKERIGARLEVVTTQNGSKAEFHV